MFKNYLTIALRNLRKYKGYSVINVVGLAIGIASCLMILLYVLDELQFDRFHKDSDRIYRVIIEKFEDDGVTSRFWASPSPGYGPKLSATFPEKIEHSARFYMWSNPILSYGDKKFEENGFVFVEPAIFSIFTLPFISGDPATALVEPNSMVLTETAAQKYFGEENPLNKTILYRSGSQTDTYKITGVIKDIPKNSHIHFDVLAPFANWQKIVGEEADMGFLGGNYNYPTYIKLAKTAQVEALAQQFPAFFDRNMAENNGKKPSDIFKIHLQPLDKIYLYSDYDSEYATTGDIIYVYIFSAVAFLVLLIACINFINLATARSVRRAREVGMRKVLGAARSQLIRQFFGESVLYSFVAFLLALALLDALLPVFNAFSGKELTLDLWGNPDILVEFFAILLTVGLIAGSYPALVLSGFRPIRALGSGQQTGRKQANFRSVLVVLQFAISIGLLISVGTVGKQLDFVRNKNLGFDKEHIVSLPASRDMIRDLESIKHELKQHPGVVRVTASSRVPSGFLNDALDARVFHGGEPTPVGFRLPFVRVDYDYFATFGMKIIAGRGFARDFSTDSTEAFVLNETAVKQLGWKSPEDAVGKPLGYGWFDGRVVGVVKDFHFESMHQSIKPMIFELSPFLRRISIRIRPENVSDTMAFLQQKWLVHRPDYPFDYYFIDEHFEQRYIGEKKLGEVFGLFAGLAAFIACLGLFGLAAFTAEQRTKEIGIRKVLGASMVNIMGLLSQNFLKLVLLANLIAWPVAWFAMNRWLESFAYRVDVGWLIFGFSAVLALVIALVTVSAQAVRAALANPVDSLRYE